MTPKDDGCASAQNGRYNPLGMRRLQWPGIIFLCLAACAGPSGPGPAVRLAGDPSDTLAMNSRWPRPLPVRAFDAHGRPLAGAPIAFSWVDGATVPVSSAGMVACRKSADFNVRAALGSLTRTFPVRCRLVQYVVEPGPIQFVLGDSVLSRPQALPLGVYDVDKRPVSMFRATLGVGDSQVATIHQDSIYPHSRGITITGAHIGDHEGGTGVHVYQRVTSLDALDTLLRVHPGQRLFAVPLILETGETVRHRLPPGHWMLAVLPGVGDDANPIRVYTDGAGCAVNILNDPGRLGCETGSNSSVVVRRAPTRQPTPPANAYLLVRWMSPGDPKRFVPNVVGTPGNLACVRQALGAMGYALRESRDTDLVRMERPDPELGTSARRDWIEVRFTGAGPRPELQGTAWAVDSYPAGDVQVRERNPITLEPAGRTLQDARMALGTGGNHS